MNRNIILYLFCHSDDRKEEESLFILLIFYVFQQITPGIQAVGNIATGISPLPYCETRYHIEQI